MLRNSETPNIKTLQLLVPILQTQEFPSDQRLLEVFGTPFANEQIRRLLWVENHLGLKHLDPTDFRTEVDDMRLQTYFQAEMTKINIHMCGNEEIIDAHKKFVLAAQCLYDIDRVRNLQQ
jgi:hypothetical protein